MDNKGRYAPQVVLNWSRARVLSITRLSMWVIAEIIERRSGETYRDFVRSHIIEPLQLQDLYVGLPDTKTRALPCVYVREAMTAQI